jgi:16S rRNA pseudouridine516 synthase
VDKTYYAVIMGDVTEDDVRAFAGGLVLSDGLECMPADLEILSRVTDDLYAAIENESLENSVMTEVNITIREGKFHQIKRMFSSIGCEVMYLKRLSMGPLELDETLLPGEYRRLTEEEVDSLLKL